MSGTLDNIPTFASEAEAESFKHTDGIGAGCRDIAQADDVVGFLYGKPSKDSIQSDGIGMHVGDECNAHVILLTRGAIRAT